MLRPSITSKRTHCGDISLWLGGPPCAAYTASSSLLTPRRFTVLRLRVREHAALDLVQVDPVARHLLVQLGALLRQDVRDFVPHVSCMRTDVYNVDVVVSLG